MTKQVDAVYEQGRLRPLGPLELPEGARLRIVVMTHPDADHARQTPADALAEIAALPLEGASDSFSGSDHDSVLYPRKRRHDPR